MKKYNIGTHVIVSLVSEDGCSECTLSGIITSVEGSDGYAVALDELHDVHPFESGAGRRIYLVASEEGLE